MKKKGFTLIELLAVIVILAIIALIATPLVLKYIEKSRSESKVDSAYSFVRNLETEIANYSIKKNGVKYKAPLTTDDFLNQDKLSESGLSIKVKGENPGNIKVCLSSNGLVEKGMFEYGKYYVLYDGKKATSSDKATFDIFTCSSNIGGGTGTGSGNGGSGGGSGSDNTGGVVETVPVVNSQVRTFRLTEEDEITEQPIYATTIEDDFSNLISKLDVPGEVKLTIRNKDTQEEITSGYLLVLEAGPGMYIMYGEQTNYFMKYIGILTEGSLTIGVEPATNSGMTAGDYYVEVTTADREFIPRMFKIDDGGTSWLYGVDYVVGDAHVLITDEDGTKYCDETVEFDNSGLLGGVVSFDNYGFGDQRDVYQAIADGKVITVTVTQNVDGKDVITKIVGNNPRLGIKNSPMNAGNTYALGNYLFPTSA